MDQRKRKARGPEPDVVKIENDLPEAMRKALKKKKPKEGWPKEGQKKD